MTRPPIVVVIPKKPSAPAVPERSPLDRPTYRPKPKPNPVAVAHSCLKSRLVEKESGFWLDGRPASLDQVMREANRLLKARGVEQVVNSDRWKV